MGNKSKISTSDNKLLPKINDVSVSRRESQENRTSIKIESPNHSFRGSSKKKRTLRLM